MYAFYEYFSKFVFFCFVCFCPKDTQRLFCWCPEESLNRLALSRCSILPAYIITARLRELECLDMWDWVFPPKQKTTMSTKHCAIRRWPPFTRIELRHFAAELLYCSLRTIQTTKKMMWDLNLAPRFKKRNTTLNDEKRKRNTKHSSIREKKKKALIKIKKLGWIRRVKRRGEQLEEIEMLGTQLSDAIGLNSHHHRLPLEFFIFDTMYIKHMSISIV